MSDTLDETVRPSKPFSVGMDLTDDDFGEFLGQILKDTWEPGDFGTQYAFAVKPVDFEIQGKTGAFHHWYPASTKSNSKMGYLLTGFRSAGYDPSTPIGEGKLVGTVGWFIRKNIQFGKDRTTNNPIVAEGVLIPTRMATPEEIARANGETAAPATAALEWTREQVDAVIEEIDGKTKQQMQITASRSKLAPELKNAILRGTALTYLVDNGCVEIDESGVIRSLVPTS